MPNTEKKNQKNNYEHYLERQNKFVPGIDTPPSPNLQYCIVIPCYNEPNISNTIVSLYDCYPIKKNIEIIVVVNSPEDVDEEILKQNSKTIDLLQNLKNNNENIALYAIHKPNITKKLAGAGIARKIGMDEAIYRFQKSGNHDGIIISLDADTICDKNYLDQIDRFYTQFPEANGCNINFKHMFENIKNEKLKFAIVQYELYLRYFSEALRITGFPYPFHTIGSCFTVKANAYCKQGGMNTRQAGEDFYFLQKLFYLGNFYELNSALTHPSVRISDRVVFGTGPALNKIYNGENSFQVYSFEPFLWFREFFKHAISYFNNPSEFINKIDQLPLSFSEYLFTFNSASKLKEISSNVGNETQFEKRFFNTFNNFFIVKGLNYIHQKKCEKISVGEAVSQLLTHLSKPHENDIFNQLSILRELQDQRPVIQELR